MVKKTANFVCQNCGAASLRWLGRCPSCNSWHTIVEQTAPSSNKRKKIRLDPIPTLAGIDINEKHERISAGTDEFNRVLGGGIVPGSVVLLSGDPGIGKSTLLLQTADAVSQRAGTVLYVTGEESPQQIKLRSERLGISGDGIHLLDTGETEKVLQAAEELSPALVIVDSAQTMRTEGLNGSPGTVSQVRDSVSRIAEQAKKQPYALFIVSHVTKEGLVAGPKVVEHLVDAVLMMEGDHHADFRILRGLKNRFGPTGELGIFEMESRGLVPVEQFGSFFRPVHNASGPGSATVVTCEGTRSYLVEIQALVTQSPYQIPNRKVTGVDPNRVALQLALLEKLGLSFIHKDVFVNAAGGLRLSEPAVDLGVMMAISSSSTDVPLPHQVGFIGEVGLRGELRPVHNFQARIREGVQNGLTSFVAPENNKTAAHHFSDTTIVYFSEIQEIIQHFFETIE